MNISSLRHTLGVVFLCLIVMLVWFEAYSAYMVEHPYYYSMISSISNRKIVSRTIVAALFPLGWIFASKSFNFKSTMIWLGLWLLVSSYSHSYLKGGVVWWSWVFFLTFNTIFLIVLGSFFIVWLYCLWECIHRYVIQQKSKERRDVLLSLWFGLAVFMIINYILILLNIFYPILAWAQLIWIGYLIRNSQDIRIQADKIISQSGSFFFSDSPRVIPFSILLTLSIIYLYLWFNLSFIPYSTAWDANHAYMYIPKIRSENYGMWFEQGPMGWSNLWMVYIAYWFSLIKPLSPQSWDRGCCYEFLKRTSFSYLCFGCSS